ncbi:alpha-L-fucosidase [Fimbriimonas ginsengisoli]|uniref:alpha-L-fucosidase n=1 Tax=Fimbriimonas ginsengisoli Gsoil 348 TaxID=661478 RepID=A0A068NVX1_FIMGI|nr:alpha-L-fucosidase [Fimbriimonas ginsengisoli]AIE85759.1 glycoside hydrolase family 29 (alpha-L-fucosidase) [Fimbriimonas ginsengisoli Gsoil 348]
MISLALLAATAALAPSNDTPAQHDARMKQWKEARFGMFIHWGLYSIPAGKWGKGTGYGEWLREEAHVPVTEYEKLQSQFNPVKFNADEWARMAKDAGMNYVVITTKHHDGFNLFPSKYTDWSVKNTPFHRDIMKELSTAVRKKGMTMGWYHSIMDWHHPDYLPRRSWETADRPADGADMDRYVEYLHNEVRQLLTDYGPIGVMWFDGEWESTWTPKYGKALYDLCRSIQPKIIVNNRVSPGRNGVEDATLKAGDYGTPEQFIPATGLPGQDWETCMTMNDHWGYNAADKNWKSSKTLIRNLVDIASKGGNYLLNIGPRSDGTFPPEAVSRLRDMGKWMRVNGDSIYGTTASSFDSLPWGRSTTKRLGKATNLYLHVFDWPSDGRLVVPGIANKPLTAINMPGFDISSQAPQVGNLSRKGATLPVSRVGSDLVIKLPPKPLDPNVSVIELVVEGAPVIYRPPVITADSEILVGSTHARIASPSPSFQVRYTLDGSAPTASSPLYRGPIAISRSTGLRAATFLGAKRVSSVVEKEFRAVAPAPAESVTGLEPGLWVETFSGDWEKLPDFDTLTPRNRELATGLSIPMNGKVPDEKVGQRYAGYLNVPQDGVYRFALSSDDGSKLLIDGKLIVDADGLHSDTTFNGEAALAKGPHKVTITWFNGTGGSALGLKWGRAGSPLHALSSGDIGHIP